MLANQTECSRLGQRSVIKFLVPTMLNFQGKEQHPLLHLGVVVIEKGSLRVALDYVHQQQQC